MMKKTAPAMMASSANEPIDWCGLVSRLDHGEAWVICPLAEVI